MLSIVIGIGSFFEEVKKAKESGVTPQTLGQYVAQKQTVTKLSSTLGREPTKQELAQELIRQSHLSPTVTKTVTPEEQIKEQIIEQLKGEGITPETWTKYESITFPGQMVVKEGGQDVSYFFWDEGKLADRTFKPGEQSYQEMISWVYQRSKDLQQRQWESYYKPQIKEKVFETTIVPQEFKSLGLETEYKHQAFMVASGQKTEEQAREWLSRMHSTYLEYLTPQQMEQYSFEVTKWPTPSEIAHNVYREGMRPEDIFFIKVDEEKYLRPGAEKYIESLDPYSRYRLGQQLYLKIDELGISADVSSRRFGQILKMYPGEPSKASSEVGIEAFVLGSEGLRQKTFAEMDPVGRVVTSFVPTFVSALSWPITLPQSLVKLATGGKTLILPDVAAEIEKHRVGVHGVIGPAIAEQWFQQDVSSIKEMQMKYPLETIFASIGEVWGIYTGGKALSLGIKGVGYATSRVKDYLSYGWQKMMMNVKPIGTSSGLSRFEWAKARFVGKVMKVGYEHGLYTPGAPSLGFRLSQVVGELKTIGYERGLIDLPGTPLSETFAWKLAEFTGKGLYKPGSILELPKSFGGYKDTYPSYVTEQVDWWKYSYPGETETMRTLVYDGRGLIPERAIVWEREPYYMGRYRDMTQTMPGEYGPRGSQFVFTGEPTPKSFLLPGGRFKPVELESYTPVIPFRGKIFDVGILSEEPVRIFSSESIRELIKPSENIPRLETGRASFWWRQDEPFIGFESYTIKWPKSFFKVESRSSGQTTPTYTGLELKQPVVTSHTTIGRGFTKLGLSRQEVSFLEWLEFAEGGTDIPSIRWTGVKPYVKEAVIPITGSGLGSISVLDVFGIVKPVYEIDVGIDIGVRYDSRRKPGVFNIPMVDTSSILRQASFVGIKPMQVQKQRQDLIGVSVLDLSSKLSSQTAELQNILQYDFERVEPTISSPPTDYTFEGFKIPPPPVLDIDTPSMGVLDLPDIFVSRKKKGRKRTHPTELLFGDIYYEKI